MYHQVGIEKLSKAQISKLLNGHRVRVKHGSHHKVHMSEEHVKKIMRSHKKGAASTIQLDPYAIEHNQHLRGGSFGSVMKKVGHFLAPIAKTVAPVLIDVAKNAAEKALVSGAGAPKRKIRGRGIFSDISKAALKKVAPIAINELSKVAKSKITG